LGVFWINWISYVLEILFFGYVAWMTFAVIQILIRCVNQNAKSETKSDAFCSTTEEPLNLVGISLILVVMAIILYIKVGFNLDGSWADLPAIILGTVPAVLLGIMIFTNVIMYALKIPKRQRWNVKSENYETSKLNAKKMDRNRKIYHIVALAIFITVLMVGYDQTVKFQLAHPENPSLADLVANYWGPTDGLNYMNDILVRKSPPFGQSILVLWMVGQTLVLLTIEITRLSKKIHFPFHRVVQLTLRYKELDTFGAHTHFNVGYLLVAVVQPPLMFMATMCLIAFADPMASTIGIRYGKHRFSWNGKSVEGTVAGALAAFITMFVFVGPLYSLIGALGFVIIDLFTPNPLKISDNLAMPIMSVLLFGSLSLLGIPCMNYFGFV
jgi:dolichol kinase